MRVPLQGARRRCACRLATLVALLCHPLAGRQATAEWADVRAAGPFVCRADFSLTGVEPVLGELAQLQEDLVRVLGVPPAQEYVEVYLFRSEASYRRYLQAFFPDVPYRRALYIKRGGPGIVLAFSSRELPTDLRHECTHALLHAVLPMVPLWLDEGLAEFFEVSPSDRAFGNPHLAKVRWNARFGLKADVGRLENKGEVIDMTAADYRDAWAWVHFMLYGPRDGHAELVGYFRHIADGVPPGSLEERLASKIGDLDRAYLSHFRGWVPPG
ncbi:MAG: hypothetical protein ACYC6Y_28180 [Thermoguttaceae bacterium]